MSFPPALAAAREQAAGKLFLYADVFRITSLSDNLGGTTATEMVVHQGAPCRIASTRRAMAQTPERLAPVSPGLIFFPYGTEIQTSDLVAVGDGPRQPVLEVQQGSMSLLTSVLVGEPRR